INFLSTRHTQPRSQLFPYTTLFRSDNNQKKTVQQNADVFEIHPPEKDKTDLEIALQKALSLEPDRIYLFGVTGGRLDHALINLQLLHKMIHNNIRGMIIDKW